MAPISGSDKAQNCDGGGESSVHFFAMFRQICGAIAGSIATVLLVVSVAVFVLEISGIVVVSRPGEPPRGHDAGMAKLGAAVLVLAVCSFGVFSSTVLAIVAWICDRKWKYVCIPSAVITLILAVVWVMLFNG